MNGYSLPNRTIAIIVEDFFEQSELEEPLKALREAGAKVHIVASQVGTVTGLNHLERGKQFDVDVSLDDADPRLYDAVVIPGGVFNADKLRMNELARSFVTQMNKDGKPLAVICHGSWLLVSAGMVEGRRLTSYYTLQDDIKNAGGEWVDDELIVDGNLISSRRPSDLPVFIRAISRHLAMAPVT